MKENYDIVMVYFTNLTPGFGEKTISITRSIINSHSARPNNQGNTDSNIQGSMYPKTTYKNCKLKKIHASNQDVAVIIHAVIIIKAYPM